MTEHAPRLPDYVAIDRDIDFGTYPENSALGYLIRGSAGIRICASVHLQFTGDLVAPLLQFTGTVRILNQFAVLTEVITLNNCTDVHSDVWDDVADDPQKLNKGGPGGLDISGAPVGSFGTKGEDFTEKYTFVPATRADFFEPSQRTEGKPFTVIAKQNANNYMRFLMSTTDNPVDFTLFVCFEYQPLVEGSDLWFVGS